MDINECVVLADPLWNEETCTDFPSPYDTTIISDKCRNLESIDYKVGK